jgi:molybdopterin molybdotransferase
VKSVDDTARMVLARATPLAVEQVALAAARGRVLAEDVVAPRPSPAFDNSAMDGYAARAAELPASLPVVATVAAGVAAPLVVPAGSAVRIFTGAPLPAGVDTVILQEDARTDGDRVALPAGKPGDNIRRAGDDLARGALAVAGGTRISAGDLALLAALGIAELPVRRAPRVAIVATGDELVALGAPIAPGQLVDSSAYMLAAQIIEAGGEPTYLGIAKDEPQAIAAALTRALAYDVAITTGGVSVGDRDYVHAALAAAGVSLELYKVAMKPGKPFSFATRGSTLVFGLPGNPVSTFVAFELFVRPALLALQGAPATTRARAIVRLHSAYRKPAGRAHYLCARVVREREALVAHAHAKQGSAMLSSLVGTNALVEVPADATEVGAGEPLTAVLLDAV